MFLTSRDLQSVRILGWFFSVFHTLTVKPYLLNSTVLRPLESTNVENVRTAKNLMKGVTDYVFVRKITRSPSRQKIGSELK